MILRPSDTYQRKLRHARAEEAAANILNHRGSSPRIYKNTLAFLAPDHENLSSLQAEVKRFIAWKSILSDKDDLNLDGNQIRETQQNLDRSNQTVELRLKETYCWLLTPYIDPDEDMKTIQWDPGNISGGDATIVAKAAEKMLQTDQVITNWAPAILLMQLDDLLWKDRDDIQIKKLWEYLTTYCYLPRLANYHVLEETILKGLASGEYFAPKDKVLLLEYGGIKGSSPIFLKAVPHAT